MNHASLFSGIGGFDLAAEWMGWKNVFHCETDPFCNKVLKHHFPNSISYGNIKETDFTPHSGQVDILTGGFPCQPFSTAGLREGTDDSRYLWPEMFRAIREISPRWVIAENVRGLLSWNEGLVLDTVCTDLESEGYEVWPFLLPACGVNAPHQRYRIWIVAYDTNASSDSRGSRENDGAGREKWVPKWDKIQQPIEPNIVLGNNPNTSSSRLQGAMLTKTELPSQLFQNFPSEPPILGGDDGVPIRLDGVTFPRWRKESVKSYGNAIVPQVAHALFKNIVDFEKTLELLR